MRINYNNGSFESSQAFDMIPVTIEQNAKMFKATLDSLYSDKIGSIVRELASNAWDSHHEAGKDDVPFDIHIPTFTEPYFSIRDYGVSMSRKHIEEYYSVLLKSSKNDSNESIGGFGLGGKCFISYADTGIITTWLNGIKTSYAFTYNESSMPNIYVLGNESSDEPQGMEVRFAASANDGQAFIEAIHQWLWMLNTKPNINFRVDFDTYPLKWMSDEHKSFCSNNVDTYLCSNDGKFTSKTKEHLFISVGNIPYQVAITKVSEYSKYISLINNNSVVVVHFGIGEISLTLSREDINFDELTIAALKRVMGEFDAAVEETVRNDYESADSINTFIKNGLDKGIPWRVLVGGVSFPNGLSFNSGTYYYNVSAFPHEFECKYVAIGKRSIVSGQKLSYGLNSTFIIQNMTTGFSNIGASEALNEDSFYLIKMKGIRNKDINKKLVNAVKKALGTNNIHLASELNITLTPREKNKANPIVYSYLPHVGRFGKSFFNDVRPEIKSKMLCFVMRSEMKHRSCRSWEMASFFSMMNVPIIQKLLDGSDIRSNNWANIIGKSIIVIEDKDAQYFKDAGIPHISDYVNEHYDIFNKRLTRLRDHISTMSLFREANNGASRALWKQLTHTKDKELNNFAKTMYRGAIYCTKYTAGAFWGSYHPKMEVDEIKKIVQRYPELNRLVSWKYQVRINEEDSVKLIIEQANNHE